MIEREQPLGEDVTPELAESALEALNLEIYYDPASDATNGIVAVLAARRNLQTGLVNYNSANDLNEKIDLKTDEDRRIHLTREVAAKALFGMNLTAERVSLEPARHALHREQLARAIIQKVYGVRKQDEHGNPIVYEPDEENMRRLLANNELLKDVLGKDSKIDTLILQRMWLEEKIKSGQQVIQSWDKPLTSTKESVRQFQTRIYRIVKKFFS